MSRGIDPGTERWAGAIGDLYDAATSGERPERMLELLAEVAAGHSGVLCVHGPAGMSIVQHGVPDAAAEAYAAHFGPLDPWTRATLVLAPGSYVPARVGRAILPEDELMKTEFFNDFAKPFDVAEVIGGTMPIARGRTAVYASHRRWKAQRFDADDERRVRTFVPHLQRALQLRERLGTGAATHGYAALDSLAFGAIVCDAAGRLRFANVAAEEAARLGRGVTLAPAPNGVGALVPAERRRLLALVHDACTGGPGGALAIQGRGGTAAAVLVAPLPRRIGDGARLALLAAREVRASPTATPGQLSSLFGLTPAEASLAAALGGGATLADIMTRHGRTENTLRTQLGQVFRKTGARTQADLLRVIALLPPLR